MPVRPERAPLADRAAAGGVALLVVDMVSSWDFEDADQLAPAALAIAPRIGALKRRCLRARVPVIFVNDNRGRWRSEFRELVRASIAENETGAAIARHLQPEEGDYSVLKPKQSAFYATPLDLLLRHLRVRKVIVTGVASDQCIVMTAAEARMRDYEVVVPRDCIGAPSAARTAATLRQLGEAHHIAGPLSTRLRLPAHARAAS
ncbi:MAG: cysteine hydrolase [Rhizobacter sp.]|nr:cysteine hydrolase [Rhizobacter sp.]